MRHLNPKQRHMLIEMARALEDTSSTLEKQAGRLARYGAMPRFIRALIVTAQSALDDASTGLVDWADLRVDENGRDTETHADTVAIVAATAGTADEDVGN